MSRGVNATAFGRTAMHGGRGGPKGASGPFPATTALRRSAGRPVDHPGPGRPAHHPTVILRAVWGGGTTHVTKNEKTVGIEPDCLYETERSDDRPPRCGLTSVCVEALCRRGPGRAARGGPLRRPVSCEPNRNDPGPFLRPVGKNGALGRRSPGAEAWGSPPPHLAEPPPEPEHGVDASDSDRRQRIVRASEVTHGIISPHRRLVINDRHP